VIDVGLGAGRWALVSTAHLDALEDLRVEKVEPGVNAVANEDLEGRVVASTAMNVCGGSAEVNVAR